MKTKLILLSTILLFSCSKPEWQNAPINYNCSKEQLEAVITQTEFCIDKAKFPSDYCYGAAILRNCSKREAQ